MQLTLHCSLQPRRGSYHPGDTIAVDIQVRRRSGSPKPPRTRSAPVLLQPHAVARSHCKVVRLQVAYWDPSGNTAPVELTDLLVELKCIERTDQSWVSAAWGADAGPPLLKEGRRVSRQLLHAAARYSAQHLDLPAGSPQHFVFRYPAQHLTLHTGIHDLRLPCGGGQTSAAALQQDEIARQPAAVLLGHGGAVQLHPGGASADQRIVASKPGELHRVAIHRAHRAPAWLLVVRGDAAVDLICIFVLAAGGGTKWEGQLR